MKQYFTGFFTAMCLTASFFLFTGSQKNNLGDIEVNSIKVNDLVHISEGGAIAIGDIDGDKGSCVITYDRIQFADKNNTKRVHLGRGWGDGAYLAIKNKKKRKIAYLGEGIDTDKSLWERFLEGEDTTKIGAGAIAIGDVNGKLVHMINAWDIK